MAEKNDKVDSSGEEKPDALPLIIGAVIVVGLIFWFMRRRRRVPQQQLPTTATLPPRDPCEGIPEWACGAVTLLNPIAKTSVDVAKAQAQAEIQEAQIRASSR